jgi:hypothetical protein
MCGWMTIGNEAINFLFNQIHLAITPPRLTRVIHPSPVLAVLSIGWAAFLHPVPDPALTNIVSQSDCWPLTLFFEGCFFRNPNHTTFQASYLTDLAKLLTYILALPIKPPTYLLFIFLWPSLSLGKIFNFFG